MVFFDKTYQLKAGEGSSVKALNEHIILHSTANLNAGGKNEASYMSRMVNTNAVYTHAIADTDRVYIIGEPGYVAWGAGNVNNYSPFQIELAEYSDKTKARAAYINWINAVRYYGNIYNIPMTLDQPGKGVMSHAYAGQIFGGTDHVDPYPYLKTMGISKTKLQKDLRTGLSLSEHTGWHEDPTKAGVVTVNYSGKGGVRLLKLDDSPTNQFVKDGSRWKVFGFNDGGVVVSSKSYLPYQYAKIKIDYTEGYGVNAYTKDLQHIDGSNKKFKTGTSWKVVGGMIRNGKAYFKVSNTEYILGVYTN